MQPQILLLLLIIIIIIIIIPRDYIDRLYASKKERRGLSSIEDCIDASI